MGIPLFLAMTAAEFMATTKKPDKVAWMACHFSPYGTGLTNLPRTLPENSLLILNDRTPFCGHEPEAVSQMLLQTAEEFRCRGILLDLQRPGCEKIGRIIKRVLTLPLPVAVSDLYASKYDCPVFLSPPPPHKALADHAAPWQGREIWLETALDSCTITVTKEGSQVLPSPPSSGDFPFQDDTLHCHYRIETGQEQICFSLQRTREDVASLLQEAEALGVTCAIGLYQELGN